MLPIIQKSKIWYAISGTSVVVCIIVLFLWRLNFSIDFTGGSFLAIEFSQGRPEAQNVLETLKSLDFGEAILQNAGEKGINMRFREIDDVKHKEVIRVLKEKFPGAEERRFETIGSVIGKELKTRSLWALGAVLLFVLLFIAWSFRKVSRPVPSWQYGISAVITLFHDVIITLGAFSALGHYLHIEVGASFIAAILTVLAYSVSDTIVVFDRIRENLFKMRNVQFSDVVNASVNQTMHRSINTSLTILLSLAAIFFFGGESIKYFALTLIIGISIGTYSSIFLASPILVTWQERRKKS
ncbi:MAG: protein translocase subunit SecF [bacterium]|nr:protein translocase subunit SecF [bacterium]